MSIVVRIICQSKVAISTDVHTLPYTLPYTLPIYHPPTHLNRWDLIFVIFCCSICNDMAVAVLGVRTRFILGVRGDKKYLQSVWLEGGEYIE